MIRCVLFHRGDCSRDFLDPHHHVKQQHIRAKFKHGGVWQDGKLVPLSRTALVSPEVTLKELLEAPANISYLCRTHHDLHHGASSVFLEPPESAWEFAREVGLANVLEKQAERRQAA